jgi:hypothetical protein
MNKKIKSLFFRKGELTTVQIVTFVVLAASFFVLLYLMFLYDASEVSEEELCYNSVVLRANSGLVGSDLIDLDCKTQYECITKDGSCETMTKPDEIKVKNKEEVYLALAEQMRKCWSQYSQGRLDYVGDDFTHNSYCAVCSQIGFDNSVIQANYFPNATLDKDDFYNYLSTKKLKSDNITYAEYFFGTNDINELKSLAEEQYGAGGTFGKLDLTKKQIVVTGITSDVSATKWVVGGIMAGEGVFIAEAFVLGLLGVTTPIGWVATAVVIGYSAGSGALGSEISSSINPEISAIVVKGTNQAEDNNFMAPTIIEVNPEKFKALGCDELTTLN